MEPNPTWYLLQTIEIRTVLTKIYKLYQKNNGTIIQNGIKCNNDLICVLKNILTNKGISQKEIVKATELPKQKISKIITQLRTNNFIQPADSNKRNVKLSFTEAGRRFAINVFKKMLPFDTSALRRIYFGNNKIPELIKNLQEYANSLSKVCSNRPT